MDSKPQKVAPNLGIKFISLVRRIPLDTKVGLVILIFFLYVLLIIVPNEIYVPEGADSSPEIYPKMLINLIIFLSIIVMIDSLRKRKSVMKESASIPAAIMSRRKIRVYIVVLVSFVYVWILVELIGFLLSSMVILAFLARFFGYRNRLIIIFIAILFPIIAYYILSIRLQVPLPIGNMFQ